mgnify:CR=1 FL=1
MTVIRILSDVGRLLPLQAVSITNIFRQATNHFPCIKYTEGGVCMPDRDFKQLLGFIMFWMAVGMLFMVFIPNNFVGVLLAAAFLLIGYYLFSGKCRW